MKKRYRYMQNKANGKVREIGDGRVLLELPLSVAGVIESLPGAIRDLAQAAGMLLMSAAIEETLTVHKLGITGLLRKTLSTTTPLESCFSGGAVLHREGQTVEWRQHAPAMGSCRSP